MLALSAAIQQQQDRTLTSRPRPIEDLIIPSDGLPAVKRFIDVIGATLILGFIAAVMLLCAALVKLSSPGPVFYRNRRFGRDGKPFLMWKFRTMCTEADAALNRHLASNCEARAEWGATQKLTNDPRITPVGRLMRRFSLDELPQLLNVLTGDMSLIGPRPLLPDEPAKYGKTYSIYTRVRPGMTGLWQVSGRNNTPYEQRVQLAGYYVDHWSMRLDAFILFQTVRVVLTGEGAY